jgi:hypothetical protein
MADSRERCPAKVFSDYLRLFPKTDSSWLSVRREEPRFPLLSLPSAVFKWDEKLIYTGEFARRVNEATDDSLLFLRVLSFDPAVRREHPEIDFCIPMAYDGASERERASWGLWAGAWCDTREEFTLLFDGQARDWLGQVLEESKFVLHEQGRKTASIVTLEERGGMAALKDFIQMA